jgi:hypothetical protein
MSVEFEQLFSALNYKVASQASFIMIIEQSQIKKKFSNAFTASINRFVRDFSNDITLINTQLLLTVNEADKAISFNSPC